MLQGLRRILRGKGEGWVPREALAAELPLLPPPKVKPKQQSLPSYVTNARQRNEADLPRTDRGLANTDTLNLRYGADTRQVVRDLVAANPDLSAAVFAYLRTAITGGYRLVGRNMDGSFNREATLLAQQIATRFDQVKDYSDGFSGIWSLRSVSESLGKELLQYGAASVELVLDKARLPRSMVPVSVTQIVFRQDDAWLKPVQKIGAEERDLDIPTYFYVALDQNLLDAYASSPLESAIQAVLADLDFFNDLRRLVKRALHPRLHVTIDEEKFRKTIPTDISLNPEKLQEYTVKVLADIETKVNALNPEDALVSYDFIQFNYLNHGNAAPANEEETLANIARSRIAAGSKTMPSILGHGGGTQNVASSETLLFMVSAVGAVQAKLDELYSLAFTLAVRLFGLDAYVDFRYNTVELRPESELEAFKVMQKDRVLDLLSLGFVTDDEASIALTGNVTPAGFAPLSGTRFRDAPAVSAVAGNPYSPTGAQGNTQGAANQSRTPSTPTKPKTA
jgi:hypothetical protein